MLRFCSPGGRRLSTKQLSFRYANYRCKSNEATKEEIAAKIKELIGSESIIFRSKADMDANRQRDESALSTDVTSLKYQNVRHSETFGQLVKSNRYKEDGLLDESQIMNVEVLSPKEAAIPRSYRNEDGTLIKGSDAKEARLDDKTILGRAYRKQDIIPPIIARTINDNILSLNVPQNLRREAAKLYVDLKQNELHKECLSKRESDAHIASFFIHNYSSIYQALHELKLRLGASFNPKSVLDIGFGPATGMVALNELMGDDFNPTVKDAVIVGGRDMRRRAKIILSRQICEQPLDNDNVQDDDIDVAEDAEPIDPEKVYTEEELRDLDTVGPVDVNKIHIRTRLTDNIASTKKYDLVIATHQLLNTQHGFPSEVDKSIEYILNSLAPGGHLILIERGTPLGFESIARARHVMIRPENHENHSKKIPRPWIRGSDIKPRNFHSQNLEIDHELASELEAKFGKVSEDDLKFDIDENEYDIEEVQETKTAPVIESQVDFHLKVIAPCSHHSKCPLQTSSPEFYGYPGGKKLHWCHFNKTIMRPKFSQELKKGLYLATKWTEPDSGIGIKGLATAGTGRSFSNNSENSSYSYLIMERSHNDKKTLESIEAEVSASHEVGYFGDVPDTWPRIMRPPMKKKKHIIMDVCAPSGSIEKWIVTKSTGNQEYHDARKAESGDLWALGAKKRDLSNGDNSKAIIKLEERKRELQIAKKKSIKSIRKTTIKTQEKKLMRLGTEDETLDDLIDVYSDAAVNNKKQRIYEKRSGIEEQ